MKVYNYTVNVKSTKDNIRRQLIILAINKKEAMKFCKDFKGLKIIECSRKKHDFTRFNNSNDLMNYQKEALTEKLKSNELYIENYTEEPKKEKISENINNNISENINENNNNSNNTENNINKNDISVDAKPITTQKSKQPATQKQIDYINDLLAKHQKTFENVQELTIKQASILIYQLKNNLEIKIFGRRAKI